MDTNHTLSPFKSKATKVTGVSIVISGFANKIPDPVLKDWTLTLSPVLGLTINVLGSFVYAYFKFRYSKWILNENISDLRQRQSESTCSVKEKKDIEEEIGTINKEIRKIRSNLIIKL